MSVLRLLAILLPGLVAGCSGGGGAGSDGGGGTAGEAAEERGPVEVVRHAFFPRPESEDFWETIPLADVGPEFLLFLRPMIKSPAEGPWTIRFRGPDGRVLAEHRGLRVDTATGRFTFLCRTRDFTPGDWRLELEVEEGGLVAGPRERTYRFRLE